MPIKTDLNVAPFFDDYDLEKQFHRILFKPSYAVQARELTQMQTILQNQIEQFGGNIYQEGTIIKGCTITQLDKLRYVKVKDQFGFDISQYVGEETEDLVISYEIVGSISGLRGQVIAATRGFETRPPDLNTFYFDYINTNETGQIKRFIQGEQLSIIRKTFQKNIVDEELDQISQETLDVTIEIVTGSAYEGQSFGLNISEGIIFQKGHFLFATDQTIIVSKYNNQPSGVSVGYRVEEEIVTALEDDSLFDNANGSNNQNAPGADRLKLVPVLVVLSNEAAAADPSFFSLVVYDTGSAVLIRNVSQFNSIATELARRTFEESGNYIARNFPVKISQKQGSVSVSVGPGVAYVKGYRIENSGERFVEIEPVANTATEIRNNQAISVNYGRHLSISNLSGTVTLGTFESRISLRNSSNTQIGTALVKNLTEDKLHLFDIRMSSSNTSFSDVDRVRGASGEIGVNPRFEGAGNSTLIFDTGSLNLKEVSDINVVERRRQAGVTVTSNTVIINALGPSNGEDFACDNSDVIVIDSTNQVITVDDIEVSPGFETLTINLGEAASGTCTVYFNIRLLDITPFSKNGRPVYLRNEFETGTTKYSLGLPDVYELLEVRDSGNNVVTDSFKLFPNQKDNYYDLSYIELIPGRQIPEEGELMIRVNVFERQSSSDLPFFTVNSYNNVEFDKIPIFESSNGTIFNLRNCLDFRPTRTPLITYELLESNAPLVSASYDVLPVFAAGDYIIPSESNQITADIEYVLNRTDALVIDSYGKFAIIKGKEALLPKAPKVENDKLVIAEIFVPGNTILSPDEIATDLKREYIPKISAQGVKGYTMADIDSINKQMKRLAYYTTLNALELSTQRLNVLDENGLSRFKNGIIVDPFNDLSIADMQDIEFNSSVDFAEKTLNPSVVTIPMNLIPETASNASYYPIGGPTEVGTIASSNNSVILIDQQNATTFRSCTSNKYTYIGNGTVFPDYDSAYDTVTNPVKIDLDLVTPFADLVDSIQEFVPLTRTSTELLSSTSVSSSTTAGRTTTTSTLSTDVFQDIARSLQLSETSRIQNIGDFVTNFEFLPYMRSREIKIFMAGLRPNTTHFAFFDGEDVNEHVAPGVDASNSSNPSNITRFGNYGAELTSNEFGIIRCVFRIPEATFFVGERDFLLVDVDTIAAIETAATSNGTVRYNAYNFSVEKSDVTISTRTPVPTVIETSTTRVVENRTVTSTTIPTIPRLGGGDGPTVERGGNRQPNDPIAQTFFIKEGMGKGSDTVFISKIDVFFKKKSTVNGVRVEIREVQNGYPTHSILPFAIKHLMPTEVLVSDDSSLATTFEFDTPIRLNTEKEYAFVVKPDADDPDYLIFITKPGSLDLLTGNPINSDWGDGVLFTSTNNRTWKSYQDEDIKFTLYRHSFSTNAASFNLTIDNPEFFTLSDIVGRFQQNELVYATKGSGVAATITADTITSNTTLSTIYSVGDTMMIVKDAERDFVVVDGIVGNNIILSAPSVISGSVTITPIVQARVQYHNFRKPSFMYTEASSARLDRRFTVSDSIMGVDSGAVATIASINNVEFSYMQTLINKTNDSVTKTDIDGTFTDETGAIYSRNIDFSTSNNFNVRRAFVYSKSNNLVEVPTKPFTITVNMENYGNETSSPFVDIGTAYIMGYRFNITNNSATTSKYISKAIELVEDFDAEDFNIFVSAYRPPGTEIKVYFKAQHKADGIEFRNNEWTELELFEGRNSFSAISNLSDAREYSYRISEANKDILGVYTYTNDAGTFEGYRKFAIKIELLSTTISNVPKIFDYRGVALT